MLKAHLPVQRIILLAAWLILVIGQAVGCGSKDNNPATTKVSGQIIFESAPLTTGSISFMPADSTLNKARPANGNIDAQGNYSLSTFKLGDGAQPGSYKVVIISEDTPSVEEFAQGAKAKSGIPKKYTAVDTTTLTADVPVDGPATIDFDLSKN